MTDLHAGNIAFKWTSAFFRTLQKHGIQHVVISPGSRSTPLTLAAATNNNLRKHIILDERSAAFTALGIGKASNTPAVLICTSGTALANYYPAVIEARQSGVPIILATADRPPYLRSTGANQAIDQLKIFGDYPVFFHEVGEPSMATADLDRLKMLGKQAVSKSREKRGAVHLNFPFRKPLEPDSGVIAEQSQINSKRYSVGPPNTPYTLQLPDSIQQNISKAQRPLIIIGPLAPQDDVDSITNLSDRINAPILSESAVEHSKTIAKFSGFLRNENLLGNLEPDLILRFGFQPTCKSLELGLKNWSPDNHYHFASTDQWQDATTSDSDCIPWMGKPIDWNSLAATTDSDWLSKWKSAEESFLNHYQHFTDTESALTDGSVYQHLTPQIATDHFIVVSNSFPARDIFLFGEQASEIPIHLNRGASGIDGVTSTAIGLSLQQEKPGILFTGDLAFLHDTNALLNSKKINYPLTVVIINNSGGSIFRMLPIEQYEEYFNTYFKTPQSADIKQLADSYDVPYEGIESLSALKAIDLSKWMSENKGLSIIECKTNPDASMKIRKELWNFESWK